jgi:urease accessory protein
MRNALASTATLLLAAPMLFAHPGDYGPSFIAGVTHPLIGVDHLMAMIAVGLLAVRCATRGERHALWVVPASFVGAMAVGAGIVMSGMRLPAVEVGIALSLLVFGVLVAMSQTPRTWIASLVVGVFAVLHGHAHVVEQSGSHLATYTGGFLLSTSLLHVAGLGLGIWVTKTWSQLPVRLAGGAVACSSLLVAAAIIPA